MKIFLTYSHIDEKWGGANNFQRILCKYLSRDGCIEFTSEVTGAELVFMNQLSRGPGARSRKMYTFSDVKKYQKRGSKVAIRAINLYSIAYKSNLIHKFIDYNIIRALNMADVVIFQSEYQLAMFSQNGFVGNKYAIIHNGADGEIFQYTRRSILEGEPLKLISASVASRDSKRHDIIAEVSLLDGVEVSHAGQWPENLPVENVKLLGKLDQKDLAEQYRNSHGFIHPAEIDPCPNAVVEALLSGLPVLYNDGPGSSKELVQNCGVPINTMHLSESIKCFTDSYEYLQESLMAKRSYYGIERALEEYRSVFLELIQGNG